jgi:4-amino-4-deoxy-L-arabinose transferase-like glycosyltransferase
MKNKIILLLILAFGLIIRMLFIAKLPLYGDELTMVYDTYSISKTGMDSTGEIMPLTFKMGAGRPGGYIYFSVPFVMLFGPTVWGVRSLSILSGLGIIVLMYFLGKKLSGQKVGIIAALLAAISPWDIYLSRGGFEAHFALFLALLGITAFIYKKYPWWAISWGIAIFTYPTFKLTLPLIFILLGVTEDFKNLFKNKKFLISTLVLLMFGIGVATQTFMAGSENRFITQNIFADTNIRENIIQQVNYERTVSTLPEILKPIFINRKIEYGRKLLENYMANISPNFLILRGDGNPRHNPGEMGMIYLVELPLVLIALFLYWKENKKVFALLLGWVLITPLATMFFPEAHALRNGLMLPALILLSSFALSKISKKYVIMVSVFIVVQLIYILVHIYTIVPVKFATFWSNEARNVALLAIKAQNEGKTITLSTRDIDNIEYAYEVYAKVDPHLAISQYGKLPKVYGNVIITDK